MFDHRPESFDGIMTSITPTHEELHRRSDAWYFLQEFRTCYNIHGFSRQTVLSALREGGLRLGANAALRADEWIHARKLAATRVERPLFIIGHPRSGTSFFHSLLMGTDEMVGFRTWQLFWPALIGRPAIRRALDLKRRFGSTEIMSGSDGHKMDLDSYEVEEFLFWLHYATPLNTMGLLGLGSEDFLEIEHPDSLPEEDRRRALDYLDGCFRRQIIASGRTQVVAKMHFSTMRLQSMMAYYPDARFVYLVRDPLCTVPSYLTFMLKTLAARGNLDGVSADRLERLKARRYRHTLELYRYFYDLQMAGQLPEDRVKVIRYDDLVGDVRGTMDAVRDFSGIAFSPALEAHIDQKAEAQKAYRRSHNVSSLDALGLSKDQILRDFAFVYDHYGITPAA
ncbi:MAG: hypothetical protein CML68_17590 [Rhodobacteraceae bacterium]|nr:hypothetical protein [Paracoccaceae bacterium]